MRSAPIQREKVKRAADELLAAAVVGLGWAEGLQQLADATQAGGATLTLLKGGRAVAALSSPDWAESEAAIIAGAVPFSSRQIFPERAFSQGFIGDTHIWADEELQRDPYFQDFERPRGVFYRAKAKMLVGHDYRMSVVLRRRSTFGAYDAADTAALDVALPSLRMAVRIVQGQLSAEAAGMVRVLHRRGDPVFELDAWGRVLRAHNRGTDDIGVAIRDRVLWVAEPQAQAALDRAVALAARDERRPGLVRLTDPDGVSTFLHVFPVTGRARDVFVATSALVVLAKPDRKGAGVLSDLRKQAFGLSARESQIAERLALGLSLGAIADQLRLRVGTVRNHLKTIFVKTGTRRQAELVALLCSLQR